MEKILRIFTKESGNVNQAALLLGLFTFLSQILALFRDRAIAHYIGPSSSLDAYYAAFRVPDLIFISIASLASITVLVPFLVSKMDGEKVTQTSRKFFNDVFTVFFTTIMLVSLFAFFIMPQLVYFIAPGFSPAYQEEVIILSRIMLLSPILIGMSNLFGTITQLFRKFFLYALSPLFYNLGIISGVIFFYPWLGIYGLAVGVVLGAALHFLVQLLASANCGFAPKFSLAIDFKEIKKTAMVSLPRTLGLAMNNLALIVIIALASFQKAGSISVFNFSYNLQSVPLNIIGISYAVAAFPTLAKFFGAGKQEEFKAHLKEAARAIVFWSLPVIFLFIVLRAQIVRVILGSGSFSWEDTRLVAAGLAVFAISILAQGMITLLSRAYYAAGNTRKPLIINISCSLLIIFLAYFLVQFFEQVPMFRYFIESLLKVSDIPGTEVLMLPLAYSIGTILNFILQVWSIKKEFMSHEPFVSKTFFQSLGGSFFLGLTTYLSLNALSPVFGTTTFWGVFLQGFISGLIGILAGGAILYLLGSEELRGLMQAVTSKFWKAKVIAPSTEEL